MVTNGHYIRGSNDMPVLVYLLDPRKGYDTIILLALLAIIESVGSEIGTMSTTYVGVGSCGKYSMFECTV